jgi:hypothetical protein
MAVASRHISHHERVTPSSHADPRTTMRYDRARGSLEEQLLARGAYHQDRDVGGARCPAGAGKIPGGEGGGGLVHGDSIAGCYARGAAGGAVHAHQHLAAVGEPVHAEAGSGSEGFTAGLAGDRPQVGQPPAQAAGVEKAGHRAAM